MLRSYAPAIVFLALGGGIGVVFALLNARLGPRRRPREVQADPYECGLPSEFKRSFRSRIGFISLLIVAFVYEWRRGALDWSAE